MPRAFAIATACFVISLGLTARAGEKAPPDHVQAMKDLINVVQTMVKPGMYADFEVAKKSAASAKDAYVIVQKFWDGRGDPEAIKLSQAGTKAAGEIAMAADAKSAADVEKATTALRATCAPCHRAHREELPGGGFEIK